MALIYFLKVRLVSTDCITTGAVHLAGLKPAIMQRVYEAGGQANPQLTVENRR